MFQNVFSTTTKKEKEIRFLYPQSKYPEIFTVYVKHEARYQW